MAIWRMLTVLSLFAASCGPPPGMPPSPVSPPVKPPPPQTSTFDGEPIGADRVAPADRLAEGPQVVVRPGDEPPARLELPPGWSVDQQRGVVYSREQKPQATPGSGARATGTGEAEQNQSQDTNRGGRRPTQP